VTLKAHPKPVRHDSNLDTSDGDRVAPIGPAAERVEHQSGQSARAVTGQLVPQRLVEVIRS